MFEGTSPVIQLLAWRPAPIRHHTENTMLEYVLKIAGSQPVLVLPRHHNLFWFHRIVTCSFILVVLKLIFKSVSNWLFSSAFEKFLNVCQQGHFQFYDSSGLTTLSNLFRRKVTEMILIQVRTILMKKTMTS
jgi:hypothetical protein